MRAIHVCGPFNNSFMAMGELMEHLENHKCDRWPKKKRRCWRFRKMEIEYEKLKARGV